jgi:hypothetical protein
MFTYNVYYHTGPYPYQRPPPGPPYGGGGRGVPRPPRLAPGGSPPKNTTIWIGRIAKTLEADVVRDLLEACGSIKEWKPATDPRTGVLKGFAFCTFREPEGVFVALEVLNGMVIDGQALALKCNSVTEQYLQWFKSTIIAGAPEGAPAAEANAPPPPPGKPRPSQEQLNAQITTAKEKIEALTVDRPPVQPVDPTAAANEFLSSLGGDQPLDNRDSKDRIHDRHKEQQHAVEEGEIGHEAPPPQVTNLPPPPPPLERTGNEKAVGAVLPPPPPPAVPSASPDLKHAALLKKSAVITRKRPLTTAFNDDDEEDEVEKKTRKLIPIQYSVEELKAVHSGRGPGMRLPVAPIDPAEERKKQLMAMVPQDRKAIFSYSVKWEMLDSAPQDVKSKLSGWINKKIKALVGDDESGAGFADFIMSEVQAHHSAEKILENVQDVLDEDAAEFVMQLFKLVIFQTEELALNKN